MYKQDYFGHCIGFSTGFELFGRSRGPTGGGGEWPVVSGTLRPWVFPPPSSGEPLCVNATLVPREQGSHLDAASHPGDLMVPSLGLGLRLVPTSLDAAILDAAFGYEGSAAGCIPSVRTQSLDQRRCINKLNRSLAKVSDVQRKEILGCVRDGARGRLSDMTIEECFRADRKGKVAKARAQTEKADARSCPEPRPDAGASDALTVNETAVEVEIGLLHDLFGSDADAAIADEETDLSRSRCQRLVLKSVRKCAAKGFKLFNRCKKKRVRYRIVDAGTLATCMDADAGKLNEICVAIGKPLSQRCLDAGIDLSEAFPGCAVDDGPLTAICMGERVRCRRCAALNEADALTRDCDLYDDWLVNASCP